jgi:ribosome-binding protein aMBF1 (putative translation factor)
MTMDAKKLKKIKEKGWGAGSVADFLDLSPEEMAYIDMRLKLAQSLREKRKKQKLSQAKLALKIKSSQPRVAKIEAGDPSVSIDLMIRTLLALGASKKEVAKALTK